MPGALTRGTTLPRVVVLTAVGVLVAAAVAWWAFARGGDAGDSDALGTRRMQAGAVEVSMTALALDRSGAQFRLGGLPRHPTSRATVTPSSSSTVAVNSVFDSLGHAGGAVPVRRGSWPTRGVHGCRMR